VLTFPLLKILKEKFPGCSVHFLTKNNYVPLLQMNMAIDLILSVETDDRKKQINEIRKEKYDLIIDLQNNLRSRFLTLFINSRVKRYKKNNIKKFLLIITKINLLKNSPRIFQKYLRTIEIYLKNEDYEFETSELEFDKKPLIKGDYIVVSPCSRHFTKTYPKEKFVQILNNFSEQKFVLVGANDKIERKICNYIETNTNNVMNYCGKLNFEMLANVIYLSKSVISNDSGVMHFAEVLGKSVFAFFGSSVKEFGFFPNLPESRVFEVKDLKCRPCSHIGKKDCPKKHFKCMNDIIPFFN